MKRTCIDCGKRCQGTRCRSCYNAYCRTPEWRKKYSKIVKAAHARGAYDEMFASEEYRRKQSEAQKRPEVNRRRVAGIKAAYARGAYAGRDSEEYRQMQSEAHQRPEVKRKISAALKAAHARGGSYNEEWRRKQSEAGKIAQNRSEVKARNAETTRALWARGVFDSEEYRQKQSESRKGKNNPMWQGGISSGSLYTCGWSRIAENIRKRDDYKCIICGISQSDRAHCVHHIDYDKENNDPANLVTLCLEHHSETRFGDRDYWELYFTSIHLQVDHWWVACFTNMKEL